MSAKVSPDLKSRFDSHSDQPDHREQVLVTSETALDSRMLAEAGFEVQFVTRGGTIAAGSVARAALTQLSQIPGLISIELDTEMHALRDEAR